MKTKIEKKLKVTVSPDYKYDRGFYSSFNIWDTNGNSLHTSMVEWGAFAKKVELAVNSHEAFMDLLEAIRSNVDENGNIKLQYIADELERLEYFEQAEGGK